MTHRLLIIFLATLCAVTGYGQTIRSLGYNATNGQVVYSGTNTLTFTNEALSFSFGPGLVISNGVIEGSSRSISLEDGAMSGTFNFENAVGFSAAAATRTNLSLGATWLTNTNVTNFRTAVGLGSNDVVTFNDTTVFSLIVQDVTPIGIAGDGLSFNDTNSTNIANGKAGWRDSLGLPLPALTNTSNVTMMRALAGSTNTNEPFNGQFEFKNATDDVYTATVSNGIILSVQEL